MAYPAPRNTEAHWLRAFTFMIFMTSSVVVSYLPLYYKSLHFTSVQIGLLYSIGPLISIISNLFWGVTSDKLGTLKKVLITLLVAQIVLSVVLAQVSSYGLVALLLVCFYFFYFPIYPLNDSFAIMTAQAQGKSFIGIRVFGSIGFAVSALLFGFILRSVGASYSIWVIVLLGVLSLGLAFPLTDKRATMKKMELSGLWVVLRQREVLLFFLFVLLLAIGHRLNEAFLGLSLSQIGADESLVGWAWMLSALSEIPIFFLLNAYGEKFKELPLLAFSGLTYTIRLLLIAVLQDPTWIVSTQLLHSVSFGIFYFVAVRYISRVIPDEYRSTGLALYTIVWSSIAGLISGTFGGILMQSFGKDVLYEVAAGFSFIACLGFIMMAIIARHSETATIQKSSRHS
ncbi:major facilitator superfamily protein [Paenibacillus alvei TS-15]|uniref:Major facilitator superfamily protein n=1 Tax=Paenibacillus alvei TS-15 TaxID=1117108 RepID=S9SLT1_PAEAL|nr:MFS transporter [Paenibacillus alvei]EPY06717.1 major facilitator superfamily protein [Paenibacillus alvei TS-15]